MSTLATDYVAEFKSIRFGILGREDISRSSCCSVKNQRGIRKSFTVNDIRMGDDSYDSICLVCSKDSINCHGHFGDIALQTPIINPIYTKSILKVLRSVCYTCGTHLAAAHLELGISPGKTAGEHVYCPDIGCLKRQPKFAMFENELFVTTGFSLLAEGEEAIGLSQSAAPSRGDARPLLAKEILSLFSRIPDKSLKFLGVKTASSHPSRMIFQNFPVLPMACRPSVNLYSGPCDDDLTYQFNEIVKNNEAIAKILYPDASHATQAPRRVPPGFSHLSPEDRAKLVKYSQNIDFRIRTLFNNSRKKAKHTISGKVIKGIKELISGKSGIIRHNMLGKRCEQTARTVAGGDPYIKVDELVVPEEIAAILTIPERVTPYNRSLLYRAIKEGRTAYHVKVNSLKSPGPKYKIRTEFVRNDPDFVETSLKFGDVVERSLREGDYVLLNRQPTLHKASMIAQKVLIRPGRTLRINLAVTKAFNCDFDGDEMNIHVPQSEATQVELRELSAVHQCFFSDQANRTNLCIVQDGLLGAYLMTKEESGLDDADLARMVSAIEPPIDLRWLESTKRRHVAAGRPCDDGKFLVSLLLPATFSYDSPSPTGLRISGGVIVQGVLSKDSLGQSRTSLLTRLYREYGVKEAFAFVDNIQFLAREWLIMRGFSLSLNDCILDRGALAAARDIVKKYATSALNMERTAASSIRETKVTALLNRARDGSMRAVKDYVSGPHNNLFVCVESGSKGDAFNIAQISNIVGQQYSRGKRLHSARALPCFPQDPTVLTPEEEHGTKGFVFSNFYEGLTPGEFFCHAMTGREGVCDTATGTAVSGYLQRKVIKLLENIQLQYDGTVRDADNRCYQLSYNGGMDPSQCVGHDRVQDLAALARLMNAEFEAETAARPTVAFAK